MKSVPDSPEQVPATTSAPDLPPARPLQVGDTLGKLLLTDAMGEGATGKVFRALHQTLRVPVAVKILRSAELERDPGLRQQLRAEAQLLAQLNHPNIIRVWDYEDSPELPYVVLEVVEGLSLEELIGQSGRLAPPHALEVVTQVADGLAAAHRLGIIHRDVKPGNILLTKARVPKLVDLGLAVVSRSGQAPPSFTDSGRLIDVVGTPAYMAPEQFLTPDRVDHRSDIYSLGVTFYHAVTGRLPFDGHSPRHVMLNKVQQDCPAPADLVHGLDASLSDVILRMMAKDADDRFSDYDELLNDLKVLKSPPPAPASPPGVAPAASGSDTARAKDTRKVVPVAAKAPASDGAVAWACPLCDARAGQVPKVCPSCGALLILADLATWEARAPLPPELLRRAEQRYRRSPTARARFALALAHLNALRLDEAAFHLRAAARLRPDDVKLARQVDAFVGQLARASATAAPARGWQGCVLVVDDSPTIRRVVAKALADYDYRVLEASDGEGALELLRREAPDLVLLDVAMPGEDGYRVCRRLRAAPATADLPVVLLSDRDGLLDRVRGLRAGGTAHLTKPFLPEVLVQVVEKHRRRR